MLRNFHAPPRPQHPSTPSEPPAYFTFPRPALPQRQNTNDLLLPLLITFLNDRDPSLRVAFFDSIHGVCAFVGRASLQAFVLPCILQVSRTSCASSLPPPPLLHPGVRDIPSCPDRHQRPSPCRLQPKDFASPLTPRLAAPRLASRPLFFPPLPCRPIPSPPIPPPLPPSIHPSTHSSILPCQPLNPSLSSISSALRVCTFLPLSHSLPSQPTHPPSYPSTYKPTFLPASALLPSLLPSPMRSLLALF